MKKFLFMLVAVLCMGLVSCNSCKSEKADNATNDKIVIPSTDNYFYPSLSVIPLQLLAYYITVAKGLDVDKPRNLAKSVTVE